MSPSSTKEAATVHSTRQLLDELDELMERMLALPIEDAQQAPAAPAAPAVAATLTLLDPPAPMEEAEAPPVAESAAPREPFARALLPRYTTVEPAPAPTSAAPEVVVESPRVIATAGVLEPEPLLSLPAGLHPRPSISYQFLLWVNGKYDRGTFWLGRRGTWFRGRGFRLTLGLLGLGLLTASVGWLVWDWLNWAR